MFQRMQCLSVVEIHVEVVSFLQIEKVRKTTNENPQISLDLSHRFHGYYR